MRPMPTGRPGNSTIREMNPYLYRDPNDPSAEPVVVLPYGGFYNRRRNVDEGL